MLRNSFPGSGFLLDLSLTVIPVISGVCWTEYNLHKLLVMCAVIAYRMKDRKTLVVKSPGYEMERDYDKFYYVSYYRAMILLLTTVSILAVDFQIYPRRFVKTEETGVSLVIDIQMDLGTGSVLFSSALVARSARNVKNTISKRFIDSTLSCLPLLVMGMSRFVVHKLVDYQEHVSEYGVHWNFYMSLCSVIILSSLITLPSYITSLFSILALILYEYFLQSGLNQFILSAPRDTFFSSNREGILGCLGFFTIYQIGLALKPLLTEKEFFFRNSFICAIESWVICCVLINLTDPSRRMNNLSYVSWVIGHNLVCLFLVCLAERLSGKSRSVILESINYNQFPYFMICNLLTGIVNLSIYTLFCGDLAAFGIVCMYEAVGCGVVTALLRNRIKLKYW